MKPFLITICGPTGIGKTAWAINLARHYNTVILSADSRQFYKEMSIGTAVPAPEELQAVPHYFIQHRTVKEAYTVGDYQKEALLLLKKLFRKHSIVIMAGGSGLYLDAVTKGLDEFPEVDPALRESLRKRLQTEGLEPLQQLLHEKDPVYAGNADLNNPQRVLRALEVCLQSDQAYSSFLGKRKIPDFFKHIPLGITGSREIIYRRIEQRVDRMMEQGLLEEARELYPLKNLNALQTVGYQELFRFFDGEIPLEEAVKEIKKNSRRFAKRQGTWFRRSTDIKWFDFQAAPEEVISYIDSQIDH
ncbi:tRNA (adenosine(37)-N6)-dimethylallyltransferase MiaA [Robiginitalea sp. IMCC44478]|uniref:tRNA (adenosine(37)-N6)-dimethylallyltransferase MiaA n=1 Tax=Robiginitalea sp. IMCC44478 TaxID=3459122 RepID=UPI0040412B4A